MDFSVIYPRKKQTTLNVVRLNKDTFPPDADKTYELFFDRARQEIVSSRFASLISFVIRIPLDGCHRCGRALVVAYEKKQTFVKGK